MAEERTTQALPIEEINQLTKTLVDTMADGTPKEIAKGLKTATGFIRRELARSLNLRITPELTFLPDSSISYGAHIASILNKLEISDPEDEETENDDAEF